MWKITKLENYKLNKTKENLTIKQKHKKEEIKSKSQFLEKINKVNKTPQTLNKQQSKHKMYFRKHKREITSVILAIRKVIKKYYV